MKKMWFNYKSNESDPPDLLKKARGGKCFVDGIEINEVWYANTKTGEVRTYDVAADAGFLSDGMGGVRSKTIYGTVDIVPPGMPCEDPVLAKALESAASVGVYDIIDLHFACSFKPYSCFSFPSDPGPDCR